uniref:Uncharacterized protein n=1 Tax=viral metagenome TaxID=1070528 RepID=A0A6C0L0S5_9ZZZZ|tara:strand:- start:342 stop:566 length:225 start_codon:yes stop_codon:yes gene_type:complete
MDEGIILNKHYKYLIINEEDGTTSIHTSLQDIIDYIKVIYEEKEKHISVTTLSRRLKGNSYYRNHDIIIKELTW